MSLTRRSTKLYISEVSMQRSWNKDFTEANIDENDSDLNLNISIKRSEWIGGFSTLLREPNCLTSANMIVCSHYSLLD
jgi:hypothetical protein